ncbi:MAG: molybdopterin-binding protein [Lachnospiraceae bacterium]|nr:molybdopterin-binding protein [Lachnospiraceae bacterium]
MKLIKTTEAEGHVLCHDITRIIKDEVKDTPFRKGHVVTAEDIPALLNLGKEHLYVWEKDDTMYHEDEAAEILRDISINKYMEASAPKEGKIELMAVKDGLFQVDIERLMAVNSIDQIMIATRHTNTPVKAGDKLLGTRVIPLVIKKEKMEQVKEAAGSEPLTRIIPYQKQTAGIITTGNEVFSGRIKDTFTPVVKEKLAQYGIETTEHVVLDDNMNKIVSAIKELKEKGVDMIACTGGMSVDPDDQTPGAIKQSGANIVTYGSPVLPGAMFLLAYFDDGTPICGLPGCVMYNKTTVFDIVLPRIAAGVPLEKKDFACLGNGGFCLGCPTCTFPICGFGKGTAM